MKTSELGLRSDYRVSGGTGNPGSPSRTNTQAPPPSKKKARVITTPLSIRTANPVVNALRKQGFETSLELMLDDAPAPVSPVDLSVYVIGKAVQALGVPAYAKRARQEAHDGSLVLISLLQRIDQEETQLSLENRDKFASLADEWASADAPGWVDNLVVISAGGISEILRAIEHRAPEIDRARERRGVSPSPLECAGLRSADGGKPLFESLPKGYAVRMTMVFRQPDQLGLIRRVTRQWAEHRFCADELAIRSLDGEAVGHFSGCLPPDVTAAEAAAFRKAMENTLHVLAPVPTIGISAGTRVKFANSMFASTREVVSARIPNVAGRLAPLLDAIGRHGGNVTAAELIPDGGGPNPTAQLTLRFELGFVPESHRIRLYGKLRTIDELAGLRIYHVLGSVSTAEARCLDRRPMDRPRRRAKG